MVVDQNAPCVVASPREGGHNGGWVGAARPPPLGWGLAGLMATPSFFKGVLAGFGWFWVGFVWVVGWAGWWIDYPAFVCGGHLKKVGGLVGKK